MYSKDIDKYYMELAIIEAKKAREIGEVPIGAVIVKDNEVIAKGHNKKETLKNPLAHAEILAINLATQHLDNWRLTGCTLYVTIEPCTMCAGAIVNSRIGRVVIGAMDSKMGACGSVVDLVRDKRFNHRVELTDGVLGLECSSLMKKFFKELREKPITETEGQVIRPRK